MGRPLAWFEIVSPDAARARDFYTTLFDWKAEQPEYLDGYTLIDTGSEPATVGGGIGAARSGGMPPGVLVYFRVDDLADTLVHAHALGGSTLLEPMTLQGDAGSIAVLADPDGNAVGLWA